MNQENFNEEIINIATSLKKEFSRDFSREDIIIKEEVPEASEEVKKK